MCGGGVAFAADDPVGHERIGHKRIKSFDVWIGAKLFDSIAMKIVLHILMLLLLAAFVMLCISAQAAAQAVVKKTVCASGCDYTGSQIQTAIDDARDYQDSTACVPYVIEITAGTSIDLGDGAYLELRRKSCAQYVYLRSSRIHEIGDRRVLPADESLMATITLNASNDSGTEGGYLRTEICATLPATACSPAKVQWWWVDGLKFICEANCRSFILAWIGFFGTNGTPTEAGIERQVAVQPDHIALNRVWLTAPAAGNRPSAAISVQDGSNITIQNSYVEEAHQFGNDSAAILVGHARNVKLANNYASARGIAIFHYSDVSNITVERNHIRNPRSRFITLSTNAPSGACPSESYWLQYAREGSVTLANNGSGLIRVTDTGHGYSTSDVVYFYRTNSGTQYDYYDDQWGQYTITVIDANTYDLQGSTYRAATASAILMYKVTGWSKCSGTDPGAGTWSSYSSTKPRYQWHKNGSESKGCQGCAWLGNVIDGTWSQNQPPGFGWIANLTDVPYCTEHLEFAYNKLLNVVAGFTLSVPGAATFARPHNDIDLHDNLILAGVMDSSTASNVYQFGGSPLFKVQTLPPYAVRVTHNTMDYLTASAGTGVEWNNACTDCAYSHNIVERGASPWNNNGNLGHCYWFSNLALGSSVYGLGGNVWPNANSSGLTFDATPGCSGNTKYSTLDFSAGAQSTVYTDVSSSNPLARDYSIASGYANKLATDRPGDRGADMVLLGNWTATTTTGAANAFTRMGVKPFAGGTLQYVAPDTSACTVVSSANLDYSSAVVNATDSGGNPSRTRSMTGHTSGVQYWGKVTCGSYVIPFRWVQP